MNIFREERGLTAMVVIMLIIGLLGVSGIGYQVNQSKHQENIKPPVSDSLSPTTPTRPPASTMGIDYPVSQGIKGQVFCNEKVDPVPCQAKLEIQVQPDNPSLGSNGPVKTIETDTEGRFEYDTVPGTYIITPAPKTGYTMFLPPLPNPVIVNDRQVTEISITYHSGLR